MRTNGQTDTTKVQVDFRNFANTPKGFNEIFITDAS